MMASSCLQRAERGNCLQGLKIGERLTDTYDGLQLSAKSRERELIAGVKDWRATH
ncbi:hypothetical protein DPMN_086944 [Dreissena polymorpha]|uniref:Uncharacterized protein n=1 Tax=Dreissena polymorpha TaxID=45954 RepID=A0A9D4KS37_DREPO|nr:hypothetical protein DPMN_086944 [Dreissena polymorpha]